MSNKCIGFDPKKKKSCCFLNNNSGCGAECPFRKTRTEADAAQKKVNKRLASLSEAEQAYIAATYHGGKRPWLETNKKAVGV